MKKISLAAVLLVFLGCVFSMPGPAMAQVLPQTLPEERGGFVNEIDELAFWAATFLKLGESARWELAFMIDAARGDGEKAKEWLPFLQERFKAVDNFLKNLEQLLRTAERKDMVSFKKEFDALLDNYYVEAEQKSVRVTEIRKEMEEAGILLYP